MKMEMKIETVPFQAMGTSGHIQMSGPAARRLTRMAVGRIRSLEQRWSRFIPTSDVSRLNLSHGRPVPVHPSTVDLLQVAMAAWRATDGLFSPFLHAAMVDIGYGRSWTAAPIMSPGNRSPHRRYRVLALLPITVSPVTIDHRAGTVTLETGIGLDFGGIAKGFSADLVLRELIDSGADGALVDIGGDMSFRSSEHDGHQLAAPWRIAVDDPYEPGSDIDAVTAIAGGVATSSTLRRRMTAANGEVTHHLVDPRTGWSSKTDVASATVVAD